MGLPTRTRLLALAGAVQPVWLLAASLVVGSARPGYELTHAISVLGQQGSDGALAWNVLGFGVSAACYLGFALALRAALGSGWLFRITVAQAVFLAGGAVFSCDPGCPPMMTTWQGWAHTVAGLLYFALTMSVPLVAWRAFRGRAAWSGLATPSLVVGIAMVALFFLSPIVFGPERVGWAQRITLGSVGAWSIAVAIRTWQVLAADGRTASVAERAPA